MRKGIIRVFSTLAVASVLMSGCTATTAKESGQYANQEAYLYDAMHVRVVNDLPDGTNLFYCNDNDNYYVIDDYSTNPDSWGNNKYFSLIQSSGFEERTQTQYNDVYTTDNQPLYFYLSDDQKADVMNGKKFTKEELLKIRDIIIAENTTKDKAR